MFPYTRSGVKTQYVEQCLANVVPGKTYTFTAYIGQAYLSQSSISNIKYSVSLDGVTFAPSEIVCGSGAQSCNLNGKQGSKYRKITFTVTPKSKTPTLSLKFDWADGEKSEVLVDDVQLLGWIWSRP